MNELERNIHGRLTKIGILDFGDIVSQVAGVVGLRQLSAEDLVMYTDEQWDELFAAAFGSGHASVRLAVLRATMPV